MTSVAVTFLKTTSPNLHATKQYFADQHPLVKRVTACSKYWRVQHGGSANMPPKIRERLNPFFDWMRSPVGDMFRLGEPVIKHWTPSTKEIGNLRELASALYHRRGQSRTVLVPGKLAPGITPNRQTRRTNETLLDCDRQWLFIDVDGVRKDAGVLNVEQIAEQIADFRDTDLPDYFKGAECYWHASSSAGLKPGLRVHLLFWMDRPACLASLAEWAKSGWAKIPDSNKSIIDTGIYQPSRVLFIADPVFHDGLASPMEVRHGRIAGTPTVSLPDSVVTLEAHEAKKERARITRALTTKSGSGGGFQSSGQLELDTARAALDCIPISIFNDGADYHGWLSAIWGARDAGLSESEVDSWCAGGDNYCQKTFQKAWKAETSGDPRPFFALAKRHGFNQSEFMREWHRKDVDSILSLVDGWGKSTKAIKAPPLPLAEIEMADFPVNPWRQVPIGDALDVGDARKRLKQIVLDALTNQSVSNYLASKTAINFEMRGPRNLRREAIADRSEAIGIIKAKLAKIARRKKKKRTAKEVLPTLDAHDGTPKVRRKKSKKRRSFKLHFKGLRARIRRRLYAQLKAVKSTEHDKVLAELKDRKEALKKTEDKKPEDEDGKGPARVFVIFGAGGGKTFAVTSTLEELAELVKSGALSGGPFLYAAHNNAMADTIAGTLQARGVHTHRIITRNKKNCDRFTEYLAAKEVEQGREFCGGCQLRSNCETWKNLGPRDNMVNVGTHELLLQVGPEKMNGFAGYIIDESTGATAPVTVTHKDLEAFKEAWKAYSVNPDDYATEGELGAARDAAGSIPWLNSMHAQMLYRSNLNTTGKQCPKIARGRDAIIAATMSDADELEHATQVRDLLDAFDDEKKRRTIHAGVVAKAKRDGEDAPIFERNPDVARALACKPRLKQLRALASFLDSSVDGAEERQGLGGQGNLEIRMDKPLEFPPEAAVIYLDATGHYDTEQARVILGDAHTVERVRIKVADGTRITSIHGQLDPEKGYLPAISYDVDYSEETPKLDPTAKRRIDAIRQAFAPEVTFGFKRATDTGEIPDAFYYGGADAKGTNAHEIKKSILVLPTYTGGAVKYVTKANLDAATIMQAACRIRQLTNEDTHTINASNMPTEMFNEEFPGAWVRDVSIGVIEWEQTGLIPRGFAQDVVDHVWLSFYEKPRSPACNTGGTQKTAVAQYNTSYWANAGNSVRRSFYAGERHDYTELARYAAQEWNRGTADRAIKMVDGVPMPTGWKPDAELVEAFKLEVLSQAEQNDGVELVAQAVEAISTFVQAPSLTALAELMGITRPRLTRHLEASGITDVSAWIQQQHADLSAWLQEQHEEAQRMLAESVAAQRAAREKVASLRDWREWKEADELEKLAREAAHEANAERLRLYHRVQVRIRDKHGLPGIEPAMMAV